MTPIAVMEKGKKKMLMRDYEDMKDIVIPKEQEEMMNIICDAWEECHTLKSCEECPDRPKKFMRMAMCTALKYTRKLIESGYTKQPTADVQEVRHGHWISNDLGGYKWAYYCSECGWVDGYPFNDRHKYCPKCGAKMDLKG